MKIIQQRDALLAEFDRFQARLTQVASSPVFTPTKRNIYANDDKSGVSSPDHDPERIIARRSSSGELHEVKQRLQRLEHENNSYQRRASSFEQQNHVSTPHSPLKSTPRPPTTKRFSMSASNTPRSRRKQ